MMTRLLRFASVLLALLIVAAASAQPQVQTDALSGLIGAQNDHLSERLLLAGPAVNTLGSQDPLRIVVRQRAEHLKQLIEADPRRALSLRLPDEAIRRLLQKNPDLKSSVEEFGRWSGPADVVVEDRFDLHTSRTLVQVQDPSGDLEVFFEGEVPDLECGQQLSIEGMKVGDTVAATAASPGAKAAATSCTSKTGTHNIAVILVQFPNIPLPSFVTQSWTSSRMFSTQDRSLHRYWAENSSGLAGASGDVYGPVEISATCNTSTIRTNAVAAVNAQADFSDYTRVFIVFPEAACGFVGLGSVGCSSVSTNDCGGSSCTVGVSWMTIGSSNDNRSWLATFGGHEGGHNFGLQHAASFEYGTQPLGDLDQAGVHCEYGDVFSVMGIMYGNDPVTGHYSAQHKAQLGWLALGSGYQDVTSAGTFLLKPAESASGLRGLRVLRKSNTNLWLWIEYRQSLGDYDPTIVAYSPTTPFSGALIHYQYTGSSAGPFLNDLKTRMLDFQPGFPSTSSENQCTSNGNMGSTDMREVTLLPGVLWNDPDSNLSLLVNSADQNGMSITVGYGGPPPNQPPTAVSVSPANGTGPGSLYSYTVSDANGYGDITSVVMMFNEVWGSANSCLVWYSPPANRLYLLNDAGTAWSGSMVVGSAGTLQNSQCTLDVGNSSVMGVGMSRTVSLDLEFHQNGVQKTWLYGSDVGGLNSGWVEVGNWTVAGNANSSPTADSVTPSSGSGPGSVFSYTVSDAEGYGDIASFVMMFNEVWGSANSCLVWYSPPANRLYLLNDAGTAWSGSMVVGSAGTLQNSQCTLDVGNSSVMGVGMSRTVSLDLEFHQNGVQKTWLYGSDVSGLNSGWVEVGNWTAAGNANSPPTADSVTPSSGSGLGSLFSYTVSDAEGYGDIASVVMMFNEVWGSANSCLVWYSPSSNRLFLLDDAGSAWVGSVVVGSVGTLQNSQCTLDVGDSSVMGVGTSLTIDLDLQFHHNGLQTTWLYGSDVGALDSGWVEAGNWTVTGN